MRTTPRPFTLHLTPSPALSALLALGRETRAHATPLSRTLRRAIEQETRRLQEPLTMIESCLDWLEQLGLARPDRPRTAPAKRKPTRDRATPPAEPSYARATRIALDLTRLATRVADEGNDPRGPWHATAFALRTLLRAAGEGTLVVPREIRVGTRRADVDAARALLEQLLQQAGCAAPPTRHTAPKPATKTTATPKPQSDPTPKPKPKTARRPRGPATGFGGLPDDAQPETRDGAPLGPRGISLDAEYFLEQAEITQWPCAAADLERGRKRALTRLHPDRMGDSATALFQRATRGYAELIRRLGDAKPAPAAPTPAAPAPAAHAPANTNAAPKPAPAPAPKPAAPPRSPVGEWPPREARTA